MRMGKRVRDKDHIVCICEWLYVCEIESVCMCERTREQRGKRTNESPSALRGIQFEV